MKYAFVLLGQSGAVLLHPYLEKQLQDYYGAENVLLINVPVGGSGIEEWQPDQPNYIAAVNAVIEAKNNGWEIKGIIFNQGESDAKLPSGLIWCSLASNFLDNLRSDIGLPYLYVFYTQLGKKPTTPEPDVLSFINWETVRLQQLKLLHNRPKFFMIPKLAISVYDETSKPYCHDIPSSLESLTVYILKHLKIWIPKVDDILV